MAFNLLRANGLFVDMGAIVRCVHDCEAEIYFLLEEYPAASLNVDKLTKAFFKHTIDGYLDVETTPVPAKKIRAAMVRVLRGQHDHGTAETLQRVHKTFYGYVHSGYAHVMETYGGGASWRRPGQCRGSFPRPGISRCPRPTWAQRF